MSALVVLGRLAPCILEAAWAKFAWGNAVISANQAHAIDCLTDETGQCGGVYDDDHDDGYVGGVDCAGMSWKASKGRWGAIWPPCEARGGGRLRAVDPELIACLGDGIAGGVEAGARSGVGRVVVGPVVEHQDARVSIKVGSPVASRLFPSCLPLARPAPGFLSFSPVLVPPFPLHVACVASSPSSFVFRPLGPGSFFVRSSASSVSLGSCRHSSQQGHVTSPVVSNNCFGRQTLCAPIVAHQSLPVGIDQSSCVVSSVALDQFSVPSSKVILHRQVTVVDLGLVSHRWGGVST